MKLLSFFFCKLWPWLYRLPAPLLKYNQIDSLVTVMIYMREKGGKKRKEEGKDQRKRSIIEELRSKLKKGNSSQHEQDNRNQKQHSEVKDNEGKDHLKAYQTNSQLPRYKISKSKEINTNQANFSQSIIVHDIPENANPIFCKKSSLTVTKCFDIQILNDLSSSRYRAQAYIQLLEKEREAKGKEIATLRSMLVIPEKDEGIDSKEYEKMKEEIRQSSLCIEKYHKFFEEGKNLYLSLTMEMLGFKNDLHMKLTKQRRLQKERTINTAIQKIERLISIYSNFLQHKLKRTSDEILTIDQLWNNVKYQEKIIEILKENESNYKLNSYCHENTLLRYEVNRLSKHNEELLKLVANKQEYLDLDYSNVTKQRELPSQHQQSMSVDDEHSDFIQQDQYEEEEFIEQQSFKTEKEETPFERLKPHFSPTIQHPFTNAESDHLTELNSKLQKQVKQHKSRIGILQVQKEYILDELQQLQKNNNEIQGQMRQLLKENMELKEEVSQLKVINMASQNDYELSKESERVLEQQNELLKSKIQLLFKSNGKQTATVQELLKLLNRKELSNYHQALMELINRYEQRISQLTNSFIYERQLKQQSLHYCKGLFNIVQTGGTLTMETIITYVKKYDEIMEKLKENEIDAYLRKIKAYSIGIDDEAIDVIKEELKDYVYQLQIRLPTLSQEYFQDGSSVADSLQNSVERFE